MLEQALAGDGRVVALVAEAGVGKSRLTHELAELGRARGAEEPLEQLLEVADRRGRPLRRRRGRHARFGLVDVARRVQALAEAGRERQRAADVAREVRAQAPQRSVRQRVERREP
ncbi:MAG: hypothetical protein ABR611_16335, partial [Chthoniobacterales bacterium]